MRERENIHVGDVVADSDGDKYIVTTVLGDTCRAICADGSTSILTIESLFKTGASCEIKKMLDSLR